MGDYERLRAAVMEGAAPFARNIDPITMLREERRVMREELRAANRRIMLLERRVESLRRAYPGPRLSAQGRSIFTRLTGEDETV